MTIQEFNAFYNEIKDIFSKERDESQRKYLFSCIMHIYHAKIYLLGGTYLYDIIDFIDADSEKNK